MVFFVDGAGLGGDARCLGIDLLDSGGIFVTSLRLHRASFMLLTLVEQACQLSIFVIFRVLLGSRLATTWQPHGDHLANTW